jgi:hypothetical protein
MGLDEALAAVEEAVATYDDLVTELPDAFSQYLHGGKAHARRCSRRREAVTADRAPSRHEALSECS